MAVNDSWFLVNYPKELIWEVRKDCYDVTIYTCSSQDNGRKQSFRIGRSFAEHNPALVIEIIKQKMELIEKNLRDKIQLDNNPIAYEKPLFEVHGERTATYANTESEPLTEEYLERARKAIVDYGRNRFDYEPITPAPLSYERAQARHFNDAFRYSFNFNDWRGVFGAVSDSLSPERTRERAKAEITAKSLLGELIGDQELKVYEQTGAILAKGKKHKYIIKKNGTVIQLEQRGFMQKQKAKQLCVGLNNRHHYPDTDNVVALKLTIESNEDKFLKTANDLGETYIEEPLLAACM